MRSLLSSLITALALVLLVPTTLILASWNALPGERLYGLKRGLESVAFTLTKDTPIATAFSLKFTDRRFDEANILLAKSGSTVGYTLLVAEAQKTKDVIVEKNDTQSATQLIQNIETYQRGIEEKKFALASQPAAVSLATPVVIPLPPPTQIPQPTQVGIATSRPPVQTPIAISTPIPQPTPQPVSQVVSDLDKTNNELEEIKNEVKKEIKNEPAKRGKDHKDNSH